MNLLFVSQIHPASGLVGGLRLYRFAQELSARGHRIVLLCGSTNGPGDREEGLPQRLARHDWTVPLVVAVEDPRCADTTRPALLRKARTALRLACRGGPFWHWRRNALAIAEPIRSQFRPDVTYGTFGSLDALVTARRIARKCNIPWVMDIKDPATAFIPRALRPMLMPRYRDAAAVTLNAEYQRSHNPGWVDSDATLIYSGVEVPPTDTVKHHPLQVALVGSVYHDDGLATALHGFRLWHQQTSGAATLYYFGVDSERVARIGKMVGVADAMRIEGQRPRAEFLQRCRRMAALVYVRSATGFHHKLLELAALGRPLIACPGEGNEALGLARVHSIDLSCAQDEQAVARALVRAADQSTVDTHPLINEFSWTAAATRLEQVLQNVVHYGKESDA